MADGLTADRLRELLDYDSASGCFTRRTDSGRHSRWKKGSSSGCKHPLGYVVIRLEGVLHLAHRLAWLHTFGEWPVGIDHKDGDRSNNRIANLRVATQAQNMQNVVRRRKTQSGAVGVHKQHSKWRARIQAGETVVTSVHSTIEEAAAAYRALKERHHPFRREG